MRAFGELSKVEKIELFTAWLDGKDIECRHNHGDWFCSLYPQWDSVTKYRIKPCKPSINWDHVVDKFNWMAMDHGGEYYLFVSRPEQEPLCWVSYGDDCVRAEYLKSFKAGTCDWKDSLVKR